MKKIILLLLLTSHLTYAGLSNISTRGRVGINDDQLIAGFILDSETTVVVRGIGPSLSLYGVQDPLMDPVIAVYDSNGFLVAFNDNNVENLGVLTPQSPSEAALKLTLPAGTYTAILCGKNLTTGVGLVEVYLQ